MRVTARGGRVSLSPDPQDARVVPQSLQQPPVEPRSGCWLLWARADDPGSTAIGCPLDRAVVEGDVQRLRSLGEERCGLPANVAHPRPRDAGIGTDRDATVAVDEV